MVAMVQFANKDGADALVRKLHYTSRWRLLDFVAWAGAPSISSANLRRASVEPHGNGQVTLEIRRSRTYSYARGHNLAFPIIRLVANAAPGISDRARFRQVAR
jgi:hypothetical protein